jgi:hypothetical protein
MNHRIVGEGGDRRLRKIRHLPHKENMGEVISVELPPTSERSHHDPVRQQEVS